MRFLKVIVRYLKESFFRGVIMSIAALGTWIIGMIALSIPNFISGDTTTENAALLAAILIWIVIYQNMFDIFEDRGFVTGLRDLFRDFRTILRKD